MKSLLLFFILLLVLPVVTAGIEATFEFNKEFDLKRPCFNEGRFCSASATCNMTIIHPDGSLMIDNSIMTNSVSYFNVTVLIGQNFQMGIHPAISVCCDGVDCDYDFFDIEITADGKPSKTLPTQFIMIILGFALVGVGFIKERLRLFKSVGAIILLIMGVITLYPGFSFINWSTLMGKVLGFSCIALGFYFMVESSFSRRKQGDSYDQEEEEDLDD